MNELSTVSTVVVEYASFEICAVALECAVFDLLAVALMLRFCEPCNSANLSIANPAAATLIAYTSLEQLWLLVA